MAEILRISWARLRLPEGGAITGVGMLQAQSATLDGAGVSASVGAGALVAQAARIAGRSGPRIEITEIRFAARTPSATTTTREPATAVRPRIADIRLSVS